MLTTQSHKRKLKKRNHKLSTGLENRCKMQRDNNYSFIRCSDDDDIRPVPRVSEKGEFPDADAPGHDLQQHFQQIDGCESEPTKACCKHKCFSSVIFFHCCNYNGNTVVLFEPSSAPYPVNKALIRTKKSSKHPANSSLLKFIIIDSIKWFTLLYYWPSFSLFIKICCTELRLNPFLFQGWSIAGRSLRSVEKMLQMCDASLLEFSKQQ